jgi:putative SOS response-associated peptidase YedK
MCGRFTNKAKPEQIKREFKVGNKNSGSFEPRYNIAPTQMIDVVLEAERERILSQLKWGLVPSWSKDPDIGNRMINARAETLQEKPSFREAFRKRRCIIPASGFYEWKKASAASTKQPFYFYLNEKDVFGFAGLYEEWLDKQTGELLETCTIITTEANEKLKPVHDRMPVILHSKDYDEWLDKDTKDTERLQNLLKPYAAKKVFSHPVSKSVNVPEMNFPELILPMNSL